MNQRALLVDWGGVLTIPLDQAMRAWCLSDGMPYEQVMELLDWYAPADGDIHPIHALERGETDGHEVAEWLARELHQQHLLTVDPAGLLDRMFEHLQPYDEILDLCRLARVKGWRTAVLSNSWDNDYPRHRWQGAFDEVLISGELGMRKPEERIFMHALSTLGVTAQDAVFVDDEMPNILVAQGLGMRCVLVDDQQAAVLELRAILGASS